jgi:hypothetical protein
MKEYRDASFATGCTGKSGMTPTPGGKLTLRELGEKDDNGNISVNCRNKDARRSDLCLLSCPVRASGILIGRGIVPEHFGGSIKMA